MDSVQDCRRLERAFTPVVSQPNLAVAHVSSEGNIQLRNQAGQVTVSAEVLGWFGPDVGARYVPLTNPVRIVDTGSGTGVPKQAIASGSGVSFPIKGLAGVRSDASAAVLNVTGVQDRTGTDLSVFAVEQGRTSVPSLPVGQRQNIAGAVLASLGDSGALALRNERGNAHAMVDLHGYFVGGNKAGAGDCALPSDPGFRSIFDGRTVTGLEAWPSVGDRSTVDGCALAVAGGDGVTWYSGHTTSNDFTLKLDWQAASTASDSGVYLGFTQPNAPAQDGLEVQITRPGATGELATGAIVGRRAPDITGAVKLVGQWNTLEITRSGTRI